MALADPAGVSSISAVLLSADGASWAATHQRVLSELFLAEPAR
jgi:hypothetical protein